MEDFRTPAEKSLRRPVFRTLRQARAHYTDFRQTRLRRLRAVAEAAGLTLDRTPESLQVIEAWSFHIHESRAFDRIRRTPGELTEAMYIYLGTVAVKHLQQRWIVVRDPIDAKRYALDLHRWRGASYVFEHRDADDASFWNRRDPNYRHWLMSLYESITKVYRTEDDPRVVPSLRRLSKDPHKRLHQIQLLRGGFDPFSGDSLIRATREFPSGSIRAIALELLGDKRVARKKARDYLDSIALHGRFAAHRVSAAIALSRLYGRRRAHVYAALIVDPEIGPQPDVLHLLRAYGDASAVEPVIVHILESTRRKRRPNDNDTYRVAALHHALAYLERVAPHDPRVLKTFQIVLERGHRLAPAEHKTIAEQVRWFTDWRL